ncbi:MAG: diguanylate cyclase [Candidatus Eremiobacter antarcticus]|nr:ABC transporter permease [Candidatus Eremiobacteraeota bacterium]MBC5807903.1 ABC transporter permease [Candidatus Eremiobacteraeota bacterium]PZR62727.1 MAG: diguanylate cyclase [Candidatus Eremiobacter sp. RRmetagenome_bin22]
MLTYTIRRTLQAIPLMILISIILFAILHQMPGGPLAPYMQNPHITAADIERLKHNFGLDRPVWVQYLSWLGKYLTGDWGWSTMNSTPVTEAILERLPATLELMGVSFVVSVTLGLIAGILAAVKPYSPVDYFVTTFAFFGFSMPVFWFALMLQMLFSVTGIHFQMFGYAFDFSLPSAGMTSTEGGNFVDRVRHLVLPVITLALIQLATWSRFTRASMQEVLHTDYMRTAAAKGLTFFSILIKHGLKNALMPVVTITALSLPGLFGGAIITESIFAWPGMGRLFITALQQQDFSLLMGYLVLSAFLVVFFNLLADLAYGWLDPRVKYD